MKESPKAVRSSLFCILILAAICLIGFLFFELGAWLPQLWQLDMSNEYLNAVIGAALYWVLAYFGCFVLLSYYEGERELFDEQADEQMKERLSKLLNKTCLRVACIVAFLFLYFHYIQPWMDTGRGPDE